MKEFQFNSCIEIKELLGKKADDIAELAELIDEVPDDCIYFHTHSYFLRHYYLVGPYPNDFANWAAIQVRDKALGEKLSSINPGYYNNMNSLRADLIEIIDQHLHELKSIPTVTAGQPFYFMSSHIIEVPIHAHASTLAEFRNALASVDAGAIYNHFFESRTRERKGQSDFSAWMKEVLKIDDLAHAIEHIDAYMYSLEGLRTRMLALCDLKLKGGLAQ
jgi:hypothetical protein